MVYLLAKAGNASPRDALAGEQFDILW